MASHLPSQAPVASATIARLAAKRLATQIGCYLLLLAIAKRRRVSCFA